MRLAKQAFDLTPPDRQAEANRRSLSWARYSVAAGDPQHAEVLLERQLEVAEPGRERAEVEFELGKARLATRGISAAGECYEQALCEVEGMGELELRAMVLIELAASTRSRRKFGARKPGWACVVCQPPARVSVAGWFPCDRHRSAGGGMELVSRLC